MPSSQQELLSQAIQAPPDVDRIESGDGAFVLISRDGSIARRFEIFDAAGLLVSSTWEFAPASTRPVGYPDTLPFVADLICTGTESNGRLVVGWLTEAPEAGLADLKDSLSRMDPGEVPAPKFSEFVETMEANMRAGQPPPPPVEAISEALGLDPVQSQDISDRIFAAPAPETAEKLDAAFEQVLAELTAAGWEPVSDRRTGMEPASAGVSLALGEARRFLFQTSVVGVGYVMLQGIEGESSGATNGLGGAA